MLVGILSDSHDNLPRITAAVGLLRERGVAHLIHAGDFVAPFALRILVESGLPLTAVFGNNDGERAGLAGLHPALSDGPLRFELGGRVIVLAHAVTELTDDVTDGADLLVHGHNHRAEVEPGPPLLVNPGECAGWLTGRSTAAVVDLETMQAEIVELGTQETVQP